MSYFDSFGYVTKEAKFWFGQSEHNILKEDCNIAAVLPWKQ